MENWFLNEKNKIVSQNKPWSKLKKVVSFLDKNIEEYEFWDIINKLALNELKLNELKQLLLILLEYSINNNEFWLENLNNKILNIIKWNIEIKNLSEEVNDIYLMLTENLEDFEYDKYGDYNDDDYDDYNHQEETSYEGYEERLESNWIPRANVE